MPVLLLADYPIANEIQIPPIHPVCPTARPDMKPETGQHVACLTSTNIPAKRLQSRSWHQPRRDSLGIQPRSHAKQTAKPGEAIGGARGASGPVATARLQRSHSFPKQKAQHGSDQHGTRRLPERLPTRTTVANTATRTTGGTARAQSRTTVFQCVIQIRPLGASGSHVEGAVYRNGEFLRSSGS